MSGGSLDYGYVRIDDLALEITRKLAEREVLHVAEKLMVQDFVEVLDEVANAAKALEWYWSGDTSAEDALAAIGKITKRWEP